MAVRKCPQVSTYLSFLFNLWFISFTVYPGGKGFQGGLGFPDQHGHEHGGKGFQGGVGFQDRHGLDQGFHGGKGPLTSKSCVWHIIKSGYWISSLNKRKTDVEDK